MMYVKFMKNFFSTIRVGYWRFYPFLPPERKNVWFLLYRHHVRRIHENFFFADSSERMGVRLISASWAQKTFDSYFLDMMYVEFMKNFLLDDSNERMGVRLISVSWAQNVWFLLSRHDVRQVHEKFSSRRFGRAIGGFNQFGLLSPKTFDSYFIDIMYVEFMRNFFQADSSELMGVRRPIHEKFSFADSRNLMGIRLISASWAKKRLISTF